MNAEEGKILQYENQLKQLHAVGIFWDIENCNVPRGKSAIELVQNIRKRFICGNREAEFMCVCDITKENAAVIRDLNSAHVTIVHVDAVCKNAADEKLRQCMRRFADIHSLPTTIILITSDVNFASDLSDFRHRKGFYTILIHSSHVPKELLICCHRNYLFSEFCNDLNSRLPPKSVDIQELSLEVTHLPMNKDFKHINNRLRRLADNCGGKVKTMTPDLAILCFTNKESASRAQKRMDGQDVYGSKISVNFPNHASDKDSPDENYTASTRMTNQTSDCEDERTTYCFNSGPPPDLIKQESSPIYYENLKRKENEKHRNNSDQAISNFGKKFPLNHNSMESNGLHPQCGQGEFLMCAEESKVSSDLNILPHQASPKYNRIKSENKQAEFKFSKCNKRIQQTIYTSYNYDFPPNNPYYELALSNPSQINYSSCKRHFIYEDNFHNKVNTNEEINSRNEEKFVELKVTNLDQNIDVQQLKKLIFSVFNEHVLVLHVSVTILVDGNYIAHVKVPSVQEAQFAISQLHRKKIGYKRMLISLDNDQHVVPIKVLRSEVIALLTDIPGKKLPLFKFRELFEKRYHRSVSISDLCKIKDALIIDENGRGRMISLSPDFKMAISPAESSSEDVDGVCEKYFCEIHYKPLSTLNQGWAERDFNFVLPNINIQLKVLAMRVHTLLHSHNGSLPLSSIEWCYQSEFGSFRKRRNDVSSDDECAYVPLEHLITCIPGIKIIQMRSGFKSISWAENKNVEPRQTLAPSPASALENQLNLFSREIVDLLKNNPHCQIPFNKFIPAYHHHFGRQCRVADYGYTRLADLIDAISHVVHVIGESHKRILTLTHRSHVKRFASDLMRVLKSQPNKSMYISDLPAAYLKCIGRNFNITDYGVCYLSDIIQEIGEGVIPSKTDQGDVISLPRRNQTPEEIDRTKQFAVEVVELIRHSPQCCMEFTKFIPAYHHHFGKQCRVADYGFNKLIELFEAIPEIVQIGDTMNGPVIQLVNRESVKEFSRRVKRILMEQLGAKMNFKDFSHLFKNKFNDDANLNMIKYDLQDICIVEGVDDSITIRLTALQVFARDVMVMLHDNECKIAFNKFEKMYLDSFGIPCKPSLFGKSSLLSLLMSIPEILSIKGKSPKKMITLNKEFMGFPIPLKLVDLKRKKCNDLLLLRNSPVDLLAQPVPSCIPSPDLKPAVGSSEVLDLIKFEYSPDLDVSLIEEDDTERLSLRTPPIVPTKIEYEPQDEVMKALLNGTLPHIGDQSDDEFKPHSYPSPNSLPEPTFFTNNDSEYLREINHHSYDDILSHNCSVDDLTNDVISSHSTPTRSSVDRKSTNRIAARFTIPMHR